MILESHSTDMVIDVSDSNDKKYSRVEQEILDILEEFEERPSERRSGNVVEFRRPKRSLGDRARDLLGKRPSLSFTLTPFRLLLICLASAIGAVLVRQYSETLSLILVLSAIVSFLALFFVRGPRSSGPGGKAPETKRWRGKDITLTPRPGPKRSRDWKRFLPGRWNR